jgi:hypothetical protein
MGALWLWDLPAALAGVANVWWYDGWENRSRSSGGYDALYAVGVHHTASNTSPSNDMAYMWRNAGDKPIGAIYLARDGAITVGAAGATNTQGKGGPYTTSKGTIPLDSGNRYMLSIEAANNGTGERWPDAQLNAYIRLCAALASHYRLDPARDIVAHFEWTSRKVDPAGPDRYAAGAQSWNMPAFRDDTRRASHPDPTPEPTPPDPGDDDMRYLYGFTDYANVFSQEGIHLTPEAVSAQLAGGAVLVKSAWHGQHIKSLLAAAGLDEADLEPL